MDAIKYECKLTLPLMERTIKQVSDVMTERKTPYVKSYKYLTLLKCKVDEANIFIQRMKKREQREEYLQLVAEFHNLATKAIKDA